MGPNDAKSLNQEKLIWKNILSDVGAAKSLAEPGYTRDQQGSTKVVIFAFAKFWTLNFGKCGSNLENFEL